MTDCMNFELGLSHEELVKRTSNACLSPLANASYSFESSFNISLGI